MLSVRSLLQWKDYLVEDLVEALDLQGNHTLQDMVMEAGLQAGVALKGRRTPGNYDTTQNISGFTLMVDRVMVVVVAVVMVEAAEAAEEAALEEAAVEPLAVTRVAVVENTHRP
eukprot:jgi/Tetstr1/458562/TSEL_044965.t1